MLSVHIYVFLPQSPLASLGSFPKLQLSHSVIEKLRYLPSSHSTEIISTVKLFSLLYRLQDNKQLLSILHLQEQPKSTVSCFFCFINFRTTNNYYLYCICKKNPNQVSCPIRKIRSEELEYQNACNEYFKRIFTAVLFSIVGLVP